MKQPRVAQRIEELRQLEKPEPAMNCETVGGLVRQEHQVYAVTIKDESGRPVGLYIPIGTTTTEVSA